ncbi:hypothetical protein H7Y40_01805 [Pedobacter sp.]|nr:hypothetical protein [Candidatus Saccharibacteria bacterium]
MQRKGSNRNTLIGALIILAIIYSIATFAVSAFFINAGQTGNGRSVSSMLWFIAAVIIASAGFMYAIFTTARKRIRMSRFAQVNGFVFLQNIDNPQHAGIIFHEGDSRKIEAGFIMKSQAGKEVELGEYSYMMGSGKNRHSVHYGYVRIELARQLPHLVLDARSNNLFGRLSNLPDSFSRSQRLELEGDFNSYFDLYVPGAYERDALYIMTPDIMAALIDGAKAYDMEIIDSQLFIYSTVPFQLHQQTALQKLFTLTATIGKELNEQVDFYADERVGDRSVNIIAAPGRRLKKGFNWITIIIIVFVVLYFASQIWGTVFFWGR